MEQTGTMGKRRTVRWHERQTLGATPGRTNFVCNYLQIQVEFSLGLIILGLPVITTVPRKEMASADILPAAL
jgi:hypothetical protein